MTSTSGCREISWCGERRSMFNFPESKMFLDTIKISLSLDDIRARKDAHNMQPRSILKRSVSMGTSDIKDWSRGLFRQRGCSSCPDVKQTQIDSCPLSPTKNVTFADDNNLSLVHIRKINYNEFPIGLLDSTSFLENNQLSQSEREEGNLYGLHSRPIKTPVELELGFY